MNRLPVEFYLQTPDPVARELLGKILLRRLPDGTVLSGRICETEAYSQEDPASHSYPGPTRRNAPMFDKGGIAYIYLIYGIHHCFNVVTGPAGEGSAVLIRSLIPLEGAEAMRRNRGVHRTARDASLCDGPGKICRALNLDLGWNGHNLSEEPLRILDDGSTVSDKDVKLTPRIGITKNADQLRRYLWVQGD